MRKHGNLKDNALGRIIGRARFYISYGPFAGNKYHMQLLHRTVFISANNFCCERNGTPPHLHNELRGMLLFVTSLLLYIHTTYQLPYRPTYITYFRFSRPGILAIFHNTHSPSPTIFPFLQH